MNFIPLDNRIALEPIELDAKTTGGIIIPDTAKDKPMQGKVISAGPGARKDNGELIPMQVKVGDVVLFGKWAGTEVKIGSANLIVMKESDVLGIITQ